MLREQQERITHGALSFAVRRERESLAEVQLRERQVLQRVHAREQQIGGIAGRLEVELQRAVDDAAALNTRVCQHPHARGAVRATSVSGVRVRPRARVLGEFQQRPRDARQQRQKLLVVLLRARVHEELR